MNVTVYSTPTCHFCKLVKNHLNEKNVLFNEVDVSVDQVEAQKMIEKSKQMGVPVIDIDGTIVIGWNKDAIDEALTLRESWNPQIDSQPTTGEICDSCQ